MKKVLLSKRVLIAWASIILFLECSFTATALEKELYPHWNLDKKENVQLLEKLETFIALHAHTQNVVVFDWDGTLYNEKIPVKEWNNDLRSGQSAWHLWAGAHMRQYRFLFPLFQLQDYEESKKHLFYHDDYLEGRLQEKPGDYAKFRQIACIEAGMTPQELQKGVRLFLAKPDYSVQRHTFIPMFDILQRFADNGYFIYIVTGSNPYYVATLVETIEREIPYTTKRNYCLGITQRGITRIIGNGAKIGKNKRFTLIYNDQFVKNQSPENYVVDKEGKVIAIERYLEKECKLPRPLFVGGNSGGDSDMVKYCVKPNDFPNTWGIAVDPRGSLKEIAEQYDLGIVQSESIKK